MNRRHSQEYTDYLQSPAWRARRKPILVRAGGRCERCRRRRPLQVHHKTYVRLGHERDSDLKALCQTCHRRADRRRRWRTRLGGRFRAWAVGGAALALVYLILQAHGAG